MKENDFNYAEYIEKYLDGEMSKEELCWFEKEIDGNLSLQKEIILRKKVNEALSETKIINYRKLLNEAYDEYTSNKNLIRKKSIFKYSIASITLISFLLISINILIKESPDKIYQKYYNTFPSTFTLRSNNEIENHILRDAIKEYNKKNFNQSAILFEQLIKTNKNQNGFKFYAGISNMEIKNFKKTEIYFNEILESKNLLLHEETMWYLSLCYLAQNKIKESVILLKKLTQNKGYYAKHARKILRKIKYL